MMQIHYLEIVTQDIDRPVRAVCAGAWSDVR